LTARPRLSQQPATKAPRAALDETTQTVHVEGHLDAHHDVAEDKVVRATGGDDGEGACTGELHAIGNRRIDGADLYGASYFEDAARGEPPIAVGNCPTAS